MDRGWLSGWTRGNWPNPADRCCSIFRRPRPISRPISLPSAQEVHTPQEWSALGVAAEARGDWAEAERAYRQALLGGGPTAETCFNLANVLYSLGQYARSGERYRQVVELDPDFWEAWNNLGTVLSYDSDNEAAVAAYYRALALNPHYADAHYNLADTLEDLGRLPEAREHWLTYLELEPAALGPNMPATGCGKPVSRSFRMRRRVPRSCPGLGSCRIEFGPLKPNV